MYCIIIVLTPSALVACGPPTFFYHTGKTVPGYPSWTKTYMLLSHTPKTASALIFFCTHQFSKWSLTSVPISPRRIRLHHISVSPIRFHNLRFSIYPTSPLFGSFLFIQAVNWLPGSGRPCSPMAHPFPRPLIGLAYPRTAVVGLTVCDSYLGCSVPRHMPCAA